MAIGQHHFELLAELCQPYSLNHCLGRMARIWLVHKAIDHRHQALERLAEFYLQHQALERLAHLYQEPWPQAEPYRQRQERMAIGQHHFELLAELCQPYSLNHCLGRMARIWLVHKAIDHRHQALERRAEFYLQHQALERLAHLYQEPWPQAEPYRQRQERMAIGQHHFELLAELCQPYSLNHCLGRMARIWLVHKAIDHRHQALERRAESCPLRRALEKLEQICQAL